MKRRITIALALAAILALPVMAQAQSMPIARGFYLDLHGGWNHAMDRDYTITDLLDDSEYYYDISFKEGYAFGGALGYGFGTANWGAAPRLELELTYRNNKFDQFIYSVDNINYFAGNMERSSLAYMLNLLVDFNVSGRLSPYIGIGVGGVTAWQEFDDYDLDNFSDTALAFQIKAGVSYAINDRIDIYAQYSYLASGAFEYANDFYDTTMDGMREHSVMVGLRFNFGRATTAVAPAVVTPAAVVTPPIQTPSNYTVYFDFDKYNISSQAAGVISQAARQYQTVGTARIDVTGYTDRSGTTQYNQALSQRRADAVTQALVQQGVPRNAISVSAVGESQPAVPTADGVREAQNRRAVIYIYY